jgi:hypothetical protein
MRYNESARTRVWLRHCRTTAAAASEEEEEEEEEPDGLM